MSLLVSWLRRSNDLVIVRTPTPGKKHAGRTKRRSPVASFNRIGDL